MVFWEEGKKKVEVIDYVLKIHTLCKTISTLNTKKN